MGYDDVAHHVLDALGGRANVAANSRCVTRLRVTLSDPSRVDRDELAGIEGVLGIFNRGEHHVEVVFGPNTIQGVYESFKQLTGLRDGHQTSTAFHRSSGNLSVSITSPKRTAQTATAQVQAPTAQTTTADDEDEFAALREILNETEGTPRRAPKAARQMRLLVINGPNINMLGIREPGIYGTEDFPALLQLCRTSATEAGFTKCLCYQSNHEGDLVDQIQDAYGFYEGIVINPGAYTHTSIALLDAVRAVQIPTIEVHISKVDEREEFRQVSYIRQACIECVSGMGIQGYRKAIFDLAAHLKAQADA